MVQLMGEMMPKGIRMEVGTKFGFRLFENWLLPKCWLVILTPYSLPFRMCMKKEFMFLTILILGPSNPKHKINVYLHPLIDELCTL
ncbi:hypothetical protein CR513_31412, partial [Mucuna pruriens]